MKYSKLKENIMPETAAAVTPLVENVSLQLTFAQRVILKNLDDISDADALAKPSEIGRAHV